MAAFTFEIIVCTITVVLLSWGIIWRFAWQRGFKDRHIPVWLYWYERKRFLVKQFNLADRAKALCENPPRIVDHLNQLQSRRGTLDEITAWNAVSQAWIDCLQEKGGE